MKLLKAVLFGTLLSGFALSSACNSWLKNTRVLPSSLELEQKTQPWCPNSCAVAVPFVATYHRGSEKLVFVAVRHAFDPNDQTMQAVRKGFTGIRPVVVILEGFPTAMGENPLPLVEVAQRYGAADAGGFSQGEAMYAASLALSQRIPFLGGEPTQDEQLHALKREGFTDADIAFNSILGWYSQSVRSGEVLSTSLASLKEIYPQLVGRVEDQMGLEAPSLDEFRRRYQDLYGLDIVEDTQFPLRIDIGDKTAHGQQNVVGMMIRDRHLLDVIEQQLDQRHSVLVVYGASHWSTLSAALEGRFGKPEISPFFE